MTGSQRYCHDGNTQAAGGGHDAHPFDPAAWLAAFEQIGGGYALDAAGKLWLLTDRCTGLDLLEVMPLVTGHRDRVEAIRAAVVARSGREAL